MRSSMRCWHRSGSGSREWDRDRSLCGFVLLVCEFFRRCLGSMPLRTFFAAFGNGSVGAHGTCLSGLLHCV